MVEFSMIEKSDSGWKDTIEYFYNGLIGSMTFSSIDSGLMRLIGIDNLVLIKQKALKYKKEEL